MSLVRLDADALIPHTVSIQPQAMAANATVNGASVDLRTVAAGARVIYNAMVGTRTDGTYTFHLQDSADNSTFADVTLFSGSIAAVSAANSKVTGAYAPVAGRPFVRLQVVSTAVTTGGVVAGVLSIVPPAAI